MPLSKSTLRPLLCALALCAAGCAGELPSVPDAGAKMPTYHYDTVDAGPPGPTALIYRGPGACDGCPEALGLLFAVAHYTPRYVGPQDLLSDATFKDAVVYVQPGGDDTMLVYDAVGASNWPDVSARIRNFVGGGGRYLGMCLGGFLASKWMDDASTIPALRLVSGEATYFTSTPKPYKVDQVVPVSWLKPPQQRQMYFQEGPTFIDTDGGIEPYARFSDGSLAAFIEPFGEGKVAVSGIHFEAPQAWYDHYNLVDADGPDADLGEIMIRDLMAK